MGRERGWRERDRMSALDPAEEPHDAEGPEDADARGEREWGEREDGEREIE